jgi:hypothetical protein
VRCAARSYASEAADVREDGRNRGGDLVHAGDGGQSDQANEKGILDQILTFFAVHQVLQASHTLPETGCSFSILSDLFSPASAGHPPYCIWRAILGHVSLHFKINELEKSYPQFARFVYTPVYNLGSTDRHRIHYFRQLPNVILLRRFADVFVLWLRLLAATSPALFSPLHSALATLDLVSAA